MRKIETQMNNALGIKGNQLRILLTPLLLSDQESGESSVYLHGNHIATIGEGFVQLYDGG